MVRSFVRRSPAWVVLFLLGCSSGSSCTGCIEPIPGGFPDGRNGTRDERTHNAITAKITRSGFNFFETRVNDIIGMLAAQGLSMDIPCTNASQSFDIPLVGTKTLPVFACDLDENEACSAADTARRDCTGADDAYPESTDGSSPPLCTCQAKASIESFKITPSQGSDGNVNVTVELRLKVNTGRIKIKTDLWVCNLGCSLEFDSDESGAGYIPVNVLLNLKLDKDYGDILAFDLAPIDLSNVLETTDLSLDSDGGVCSFIGCEGLDLTFVKDLLMDFLKGTINRKVRDIVDMFRCRACDPVTTNCPQGSSCNRDQNVCYKEYKPDNDPDVDRRVCPPALFGMEGRVGVGDVLASFGGPPAAKLDVYAVAGGRNPDGTPSVSAKTVERGGLKVGIMAGTRAPELSNCVPLRQWTPRQQPQAIDFDKEAGANGITDYAVGMSLSDSFLDKAMFDSYAAGLLCLNVDSSVSTFLSSALFRTFLPSLGVLTQGQDVPMLIALRPRQAPSVVIGRGTTKVGPDGQEVPDDPLITVSLKELGMDFYALIEERQARLFSLTTDIDLPLSLRFDPTTNSVKPVLASLQGAVSQIRATNSEMLSEDPQVVADLLGAVIGLVEPMLATMLVPIELPTLNGFKLVVLGARGAVKLPGPGYEHLALFTELQIMPAQPLVVATETSATVVEGFVPEVAQLRSGARPFVVLDVQGYGPEHAAFAGREYSWRADGGLWSPWTRSQRIRVENPVLMLQGRHVVEVTSREAGVDGTEDPTPAVVHFVVDYEAPAVRFDVQADTGELVTVASDAVTPAAQLAYRYRFDGGAWTDAGAARVFQRGDITGTVEVEVTDEAGRSASASYGRMEQAVVEQSGSASAGPAQAGCTQAGAAAFALLGLASLALRRRRTR